MAGRINGVNRAFVISTDDDGENRLWEVVPHGTADRYFQAEDNVIVVTENPVGSQFESRRFVFGETPYQIKRLDLWPAEISGEVAVQVYWRADNRTKWQLWDTFSMCATMTNADNTPLLNLDTQERGRVKSLTAPNVNDDIDNQQADIGFGFQVKVVWQGDMLLDRLKLWAEAKDDTAYSNIPDLQTACVKNSVANNESSYSIPVGGLGSPYTKPDGTAYTDPFGIPYTKPIS
jgi:hypothetical protein